MAKYSELIIEQGATFNADVSLIDGLNQKINLYSYSASSQMRKSYDSTSAYSFIVSITDSANGTLRMAMSSANTANIKSGRYVYDLVISNTTIQSRVIEGIVTVLPSVTR